MTEPRKMQVISSHIRRNTTANVLSLVPSVLHALKELLLQANVGASARVGVGAGAAKAAEDGYGFLLRQQRRDEVKYTVGIEWLMIQGFL